MKANVPADEKPVVPMAETEAGRASVEASAGAESAPIESSEAAEAAYEASVAQKREAGMDEPSAKRAAAQETINKLLNLVDRQSRMFETLVGRSQQTVEGAVSRMRADKQDPALKNFTAETLALMRDANAKRDTAKKSVGGLYIVESVGNGAAMTTAERKQILAEAGGLQPWEQKAHDAKKAEEAAKAEAEQAAAEQKEQEARAPKRDVRGVQKELLTARAFVRAAEDEVLAAGARPGSPEHVAAQRAVAEAKRAMAEKSALLESVSGAKVNWEQLNQTQTPDQFIAAKDAARTRLKENGMQVPAIQEFGPTDLLRQAVKFREMVRAAEDLSKTGVVADKWKNEGAKAEAQRLLKEAMEAYKAETGKELTFAQMNEIASPEEAQIRRPEAVDRVKELQRAVEFKSYEQNVNKATALFDQMRRAGGKETAPALKAQWDAARTEVASAFAKMSPADQEAMRLSWKSGAAPSEVANAVRNVSEALKGSVLTKPFEVGSLEPPPAAEAAPAEAVETPAEAAEAVPVEPEEGASLTKETADALNLRQIDMMIESTRQQLGRDLSPEKKQELQKNLNFLQATMSERVRPAPPTSTEAAKLARGEGPTELGELPKTNERPVTGPTELGTLPATAEAPTTGPTELGTLPGIGELPTEHGPGMPETAPAPAAETPVPAEAPLAASIETPPPAPAERNVDARPPDAAALAEFATRLGSMDAAQLGAEVLSLIREVQALEIGLNAPEKPASDEDLERLLGEAKWKQAYAESNLAMRQKEEAANAPVETPPAQPAETPAAEAPAAEAPPVPAPEANPSAPKPRVARPRKPKAPAAPVAAAESAKEQPKEAPSLASTEQDLTNTLDALGGGDALKTYWGSEMSGLRRAVEDALAGRLEPPTETFPDPNQVFVQEYAAYTKQNQKLRENAAGRSEKELAALESNDPNLRASRDRKKNARNQIALALAQTLRNQQPKPTRQKAA